LEAARLNLIKQGNLAAADQFDQMLKNIQAMNDAAVAAGRYSDILAVLADQTISTSEIEVLAKSGGFQPNKLLPTSQRQLALLIFLVWVLLDKLQQKVGIKHLMLSMPILQPFVECRWAEQEPAEQEPAEQEPVAQSQLLPEQPAPAALFCLAEPLPA
jgi:hypothetical protein